MTAMARISGICYRRKQSQLLSSVPRCALWASVRSVLYFEMWLHDTVVSDKVQWTSISSLDMHLSLHAFVIGYHPPSGWKEKYTQVVTELTKQKEGKHSRKTECSDEQSVHIRQQRVRSPRFVREGADRPGDIRSKEGTARLRCAARAP